MGRKREEVRIAGGDELGAARPFLRMLADHGPMTQTEMSRRLKVTTAATNLHFLRMAEEGLIEPVANDPHSGMGRPAKRWRIAAERNFSLGFVLLPPSLHVALADFNDRIVAEEQHDFNHYPDMAAKNELLCRLYRRLRDQAAAAGGKIRNIFYGVPGDPDWSSGALRRVVAMPELTGFNLRKTLHDNFGVFSRDYTFKHAEMLGELQTAKPDDIIMIVSWEMGLGIVFGSRLGILNNALPEPSSFRDIGHSRLVKDGRLCRCGLSGCLEAYSGGWVLLEALHGRAATLNEFMALVEQDDPEALAALAAAAGVLGHFLARLAALFSVNRIVISGPMERVFPRVRRHFEEGLLEVLTADELGRIHFVVRPLLDGAMVGGCLAARKLFFDPSFIDHDGRYNFEPFTPYPAR